VGVPGGALRVRPGERVTAGGREVELVPPGTLALREALAAWRTERYKADGVPPYVVASDKVLDALATSRPTTAAELLAISGIGQAKVDTYGDDILAVVAGTPPPPGPEP
jgi:DNA helicase-2/ATP-dependent DNA helicase PcrA